MAKILIIDDERSIRNALKDVLEFEGYVIELAEDGMKGLEMVKSVKYDLIFCDIKMPNMDGVEVLTKIREEIPDQTIVMISGHGSVDTAVECIKKGAFDFIEKPLDLNRLLVCVKNALDHKTLVQETKVLKKKVAQKMKMVGESPAMIHLRDVIERVAPTDARVLITGENGTGKEVVARTLYELSNRASGAFVEVNCAAIPSELIESELFGHEKGAFTSAIKQRIGKFEQADGGTIFLDEVGDMSLPAQTKVLRVLQEKELTRVGSDKSIKVDVRVFAATNKDLKKEIQNGNFREDLYHRLSVIPIHVPPLRDRLEDIPLLVEHFSQIICEEQGIPLKTFDAQAIEELKKFTWSGNIRELRNVVERVIILCGKTISAEDVKMYASPNFL
ncbi:MAG: sigma-54-dependent Fis family transcriptional regulator [Paludibacteraceae bacterium]|nr:sigma-54-dependent Fis family transcriptional regulator [Paludibacteraceae bacterium]MBR5972302.1 sigma-54-dependent Fis family transcriptional regulator [Paludibacteraceae bacterium]